MTTYEKLCKKVSTIDCYEKAYALRNSAWNANAKDKITSNELHDILNKINKASYEY